MFKTCAIDLRIKVIEINHTLLHIQIKVNDPTITAVLFVEYWGKKRF